VILKIFRQSDLRDAYDLSGLGVGLLGHPMCSGLRLIGEAGKSARQVGGWRGSGRQAAVGHGRRRMAIGPGLDGEESSTRLAWRGGGSEPRAVPFQT
jgi:hypothetical protein